MAQGFYELLGVEPRVGPEELHAAFQRRLAELVRRLRAARRAGADVTILEAQERELREAYEVLSDPARRRSYDAYRRACVEGMPEDAESLWALARGAFVEPSVVAAVETLRALTGLPVGDPLDNAGAPLPEPPRAASPPPAAARPEPATPEPPPPPAAPEPPPADAGVTLVEPPPPPPRAEPPTPAAVPATDAGETIAEPTDAELFEIPLPRPDTDLFADLDPSPGAEPVGPEPEPAAAPVPDEDEVDRLARQHGFDGAFLRAVRELRGLSLDDLARATHISTRYLEALEDNAFDRLPAATFVRGYLRQVAAVLDVEDRGFVEGYMQLFSMRGS